MRWLDVDENGHLWFRRESDWQLAKASAFTRPDGPIVFLTFVRLDEHVSRRHAR